MASGNSLPADEPGSEHAPPDPVFVGGVPRSGTTVVGRLVGRHPEYALIPTEARFHSDPAGLVGLLEGHVAMEQFLRRMRRRWFHRVLPDGRVRGLARFLGAEDFEAALDDFTSSFELQPREASTTLIRSLLDPVAHRAGKRTWVEMSPRNASAAHILHTLFPGTGLIHCVRDGRDAARSLVRKRRWTADQLPVAMDLWRSRFEEAALGAGRLPASQVLVLPLERLVVTDREASFASLSDFLGGSPGFRMRRYFKRHVRPDLTEIGGWKTEAAEGTRTVELLYDRALVSLRSTGVTPPPSS